MTASFDELAREAQMLGQLDHQNILPFVGLCTTSDPGANGPSSMVLVTPWCPQTLRQWIDDDPGSSRCCGQCSRHVR